MPAVNVCLWNIQNFGQQLGRYDGRGFYNDLRNRFLSRFVAQHDIDVLMVQEVVPGAQPALADLVTKLNALYTRPDWAYSFCASAIRNDAVNVVTTNADLIDRTGARSECLGVVWRTQSTRFTMVPAVHQVGRATTTGVASPLNISQLGRPTGITDPLRQYFGATGGFTRDGVYPWEPGGTGGLVRAAAWPRLEYPRTSLFDARRPYWSQSRRPAYVVVQLAGGGRTLCPIAAYHAPSNAQLAAWGAFMSGLARELYVVDGVDGTGQPTPALTPVLANAGFFGGDFNYAVSQATWPSDYRYFVDQRGQTGDTGAFQATTPPPTAATTARRTTVQIVTGIFHNQPINSTNTDDYLRYKIDLGFHRQVADIASIRVDLLPEIMANPTGVYDDALVRTEAWMAFVETQIANPFYPYPQRLDPTGPQYRKPKKVGRRTVYTWVPTVCGAWGGTFVDWAETRRQFAAHNITDARRAAEYFHIFVSDHLPLVATINF